MCFKYFRWHTFVSILFKNSETLRMRCILFLFLLSSVFGFSLSLKNSYTAAVVNYSPVPARYAIELLEKNVEQYVNHIRYASREYADIIVFPEFGLVDIYTLYATIYDNKSLGEYSSFVPDPTLNVVPCEDQQFSKYSVQLVNISCAARLHGIYTVFNLPEKELSNETDSLLFYNTNVVLNRHGAVIARYRKVHLSEEPFFEPGSEIVTFTTDFNVTFATFICFDLLFQFPTLSFLESTNVTDVIFTTAWYSETPFLQALSMQHGYVKANRLNFLGAGLQDSVHSDGGSAIYLADGTVAGEFITSKRETKVLIADVPILKRRPPNSCNHKISNEIKSTEPPKKGNFSDIDNFPLSTDYMEGYLFEPLSKRSTTRTRMCTEDNEFCCLFNITIDNSSNIEPDYTHKLALYQGMSPFGSKILGGVRVCALVACLNETDESCGERVNTTSKGHLFKVLQIHAVISKGNDTYNQPSTLQTNLRPISDYYFCETEVNQGTKTRLTMAITSPQDSILTFGIYGRTYNLDTFEVPTSSETPPYVKSELNITLIWIVISVSTLILLSSAVIMYKFCMKKE